MYDMAHKNTLTEKKLVIPDIYMTSKKRNYKLETVVLNGCLQKCPQTFLFCLLRLFQYPVSSVSCFFYKWHLININYIEKAQWTSRDVVAVTCFYSYSNESVGTLQ